VTAAQWKRTRAARAATHKAEETMNTSRAFLSASCVAVLLSVGGPARAAGNASAADAKAMLERAVAAVKADEVTALAAFSHGAEGFRDRDLYVFCARRDGKVDAHIDPAQIGRNIKDQYDIDGVAFGQEMMAIAAEGQIKAVSYMWPEPGSHVPTAKISFVTRVADQVCGVGYYK
jgi:signal transduction histidine kinase